MHLLAVLDLVVQCARNKTIAFCLHVLLVVVSDYTLVFGEGASRSVVWLGSAGILVGVPDRWSVDTQYSGLARNAYKFSCRHKAMTGRTETAGAVSIEEDPVDFKSHCSACWRPRDWWVRSRATGSTPLGEMVIAALSCASDGRDGLVVALVT